ncbi:hypothetical protein J8273_2984 [Carpediemonas membranifera]|uniref:Uncharacterized protein n=1 Tax=Carpediemonas membranifera TaxID=201153 RepID=A0A8J6B985_9EUKA|nr:hypothetical protein J8273_2984 [Carpediemonas membranifera]|eukprot:KAG9395417.1 hypothetical protein J8273_2984 [Carpediemonas membranifera]
MLSSRLNSISLDLESKKDRIALGVNEKLKLLTSRLDEIERDREGKFTSLSSSISNMEGEIQAAEAEHDQAQRSASRLVQEWQDTFQTDLNELKASRTAYEKRAMSALESRMEEALQQCRTEDTKHNWASSELSKRMSAELDTIEQALKADEEAWAAAIEASIAQFGDRVESVKRMVAGDQAAQEQVEYRWIERLNDVGHELSAMLRVERQERVEVEDTLVGLLEMTCVKIKEAEAI